MLSCGCNVAPIDSRRSCWKGTRGRDGLLQDMIVHLWSETERMRAELRAARMAERALTKQAGR